MFEETFPYQMRYNSKVISPAEAYNQIYPWCENNFGECARYRIGANTVLDSKGRWAHFGRSYYFRDTNDAFWFKVAWT